MKAKEAETLVLPERAPSREGKDLVPKKLRKFVNLIRYGFGILRKNLFCICTSTFFI